MSVVYVTTEFDGREAELEACLPGATFIYRNGGEVDKAVVEKADIIIGNVPATMLKDAKNLKFMQTNSAGVNQFVEDGIFDHDVVLCSSTGAYGPVISEYIIAAIMTMFKRYQGYLEHKKEHKWASLDFMRVVEGSKFLIVGAGDIGSTFAKKIKALGGYTIGIRRTPRNKPEEYDEMYSMDQLEQLLPTVDVAVFALPKTSATTHLMDKEKISLMRKDAFIVNVGRGDCFVNEDLAECLNEGVIEGAVIDVTEVEPLPADHPLWDAKNLIITPHVSGGYRHPYTLIKVQDIAIRNLRAYVNGEPLQSQIDFKAGYRKA